MTELSRSRLRVELEHAAGSLEGLEAVLRVQSAICMIGDLAQHHRRAHLGAGVESFVCIWPRHEYESGPLSPKYDVIAGNAAMVRIYAVMLRRRVGGVETIRRG